jgi:hypothetical protein
MSIRGKTRVSHQARKRLKSLIHMGTMSAIQLKGDLQDYYLRKLGEGKHTIRTADAAGFECGSQQTNSPGLCSGSSGRKISGPPGGQKL